MWKQQQKSKFLHIFWACIENFSKYSLINDSVFPFQHFAGGEKPKIIDFSLVHRPDRWENLQTSLISQKIWGYNDSSNSLNNNKVFLSIYNAVVVYSYDKNMLLAIIC